METLPKGTTQEEWDQYYIDLELHQKYMLSWKPQEPNPQFFLSANDFQIAMEQYRKTYSEWLMADSCDAPNKPGYYRANND